MRRHQRFAKRDANHRQIVQALKVCGVRVMDLSIVGGGCPDLLCSWRGYDFLIEVKDGSKRASQRKLTPMQREFLDSWEGPVYVVSGIADVAEVLNGLV